MTSRRSSIVKVKGQGHAVEKRKNNYLSQDIIFEIGITRATQAVKLSADPRNSAFFRGFLVITEISVNLVRNLKSCMGVGSISGTTGPTEMVHLSKVAEFCREVCEVLFCTLFSSEITTNLGEM